MNPYPFTPFNDYNYEKIINKLDRLEKNIRIIENRLNKIEKIDNNSISDNPTDMYMI